VIGFADERTVPGLLQRVSVEHPAREAMVQDATRLTFAELHERVRVAAESVIGLGLARGETAAIWAPNSIDWALAALAVLFCGGTVVPVNTRYTAHEARDIIGRSRARIVFAAEAFLGRAFAAEAAAMDLHGTVVPFVQGWCSIAGGRDARVELDRRLNAIRPGDISHIQFTSGTTGRPKGALLRHDPMVATTAAWARVVGLRPGDRYPVISPFSHIGGHKTGLLACISAASTSYPLAVLDVEQLTRLIDHEGVTILQGPPTLFHALVQEADTKRSRFSTLRVGVTGGAVVPPTLVRAMLDVLRLDAVHTSYGLSESTGVCTITRAGDPVDVVAFTSGRPIDGVEIRLADPADPSGEARDGRGEILVRGFNVMAGYLDDQDATGEAIVDGWLRTGDIGWVGEDGNLRIVDRLKDMVIVGGLNAYPAEIEHTLLEHPDIDQAAVVGLADDRLGETVAAFVVRRDSSLDEDAVISFCRERLANFKVPRHVWFVSVLPTNAAGKVEKPTLRAEADRRGTGVRRV
jgi:acyl-CoA synthetase (AMP-forming)/AMP-acid ligase II